GAKSRPMPRSKPIGRSAACEAAPRLPAPFPSRTRAGLLLAAGNPRTLCAASSVGIRKGDRRVQEPFYDALETRSPEEREAALMAQLPRVIAAAKERAPAYRQRLAGVRPEDVIDRRALADLPITRKSELIEMQRRE